MIWFIWKAILIFTVKTLLAVHKNSSSMSWMNSSAKSIFLKITMLNYQSKIKKIRFFLKKMILISLRGFHMFSKHWTLNTKRRKHNKYQKQARWLKHLRKTFSIIKINWYKRKVTPNYLKVFPKFKVQP